MKIMYKRSAEDLTHKRNNKDNSGRAVRSTACISEYKVNSLAFVDDIALLVNDSTQALQQLDALEHEAKKAGLEIKAQKKERMRLKQIGGPLC